MKSNRSVHLSSMLYADLFRYLGHVGTSSSYSYTCVILNWKSVNACKYFAQTFFLNKIGTIQSFYLILLRDTEDLLQVTIHHIYIGLNTVQCTWVPIHRNSLWDTYSEGTKDTHRFCTRGHRWAINPPKPCSNIALNLYLYQILAMIQHLVLNNSLNCFKMCIGLKRQCHEIFELYFFS